MIPVAWLELRSWRRLRIAVGVLVAGATLFTVVAVTLALMPDKLWPRTELLAYWQGQSRIYFENDYLLVVTTPMLFAYALAARSWPRRILAMGLVTLSAGAIALSLTRSIMVATTLACLAAPVVAGAWRRDLRGWLRPGRLLAFGGLLAAAAVAVLVGLGSLHAARKVDDISRLRDRFSSLVAPSRLDSSFQGRVTSYRLALDSVVLAPTIGHGVGALVRIPWAKARRGREVRVEGYEPAVDDLPLTILLKAGLLGLAVALWFAWRLVGLLLTALRDRPAAQAWVAATLLSGIVGLLLISLLQTVLVTGRFAILFAVMCAIADRLAQGFGARPAT